MEDNVIGSILVSNEAFALIIPCLISDERSSLAYSGKSSITQCVYYAAGTHQRLQM